MPIHDRIKFRKATIIYKSVNDLMNQMLTVTSNNSSEDTQFLLIIMNYTNTIISKRHQHVQGAKGTIIRTNLTYIMVMAI